MEEQFANIKTQKLNDYDLLKRRFDQSGINCNQMKLLKSFCRKLEKIYEPLKEVSLIKNIALFSQLLMMREFEVVYWAALNQKSDIEDIIAENKNEEHPQIMIL